MSVDDCVLDKPYSQYLAFVGYFWSGKHKRSVKDINLITLYYTDLGGQHLPVNFRRKFGIHHSRFNIKINKSTKIIA